MAFVGSQRAQSLQALLETQRAAMQGNGDNAYFTREVGHSARLAIQAFGAGNYAQAVRRFAQLFVRRGMRLAQAA